MLNLSTDELELLLVALSVYEEHLQLQNAYGECGEDLREITGLYNKLVHAQRELIKVPE